MKRMSLLLAAALLWGGCNISHQTTATGTSGSTSVWAWDANGKKVEVRAEREVQYNADYTGIVSVAEDGWFEIEEDKGKGGRLKVTAGDGGVLEYQYWKNNRETPFGPGGERWLAEVLRRAVAHGMDGQKRAQRILENDGPDAVLAEVDRLESDYAKRIYLTAVLEADEAGVDDVREALVKTAAFESDYDGHAV